MWSGGIRLVYSIIRAIWPSSVHSDNFRKFELFVGLTQLFTLKVAFQEEYMMEHLSVIAHWNRDEDTYMVGWLDTGFSDRRRRGS